MLLELPFCNNLPRLIDPQQPDSTAVHPIAQAPLILATHPQLRSAPMRLISSINPTLRVYVDTQGEPDLFRVCRAREKPGVKRRTSHVLPVDMYWMCLLLDTAPLLQWWNDPISQSEDTANRTWLI
jgi:hypothetical protein